MIVFVITELWICLGTKFDYVYSSQDNAKNGIVLEPVTVWARGEELQVFYHSLF